MNFFSGAELCTLFALDFHERTPRMSLCFSKLNAGRSSAPPCDSRKLLLKRRAGDRRSAAVRGVTDDAALVAEKSALSTLSYGSGPPCDRVGLAARASADCRGCRGAHIGEVITALGCRCRSGRSQNGVNQ